MTEITAGGLGRKSATPNMMDCEKEIRGMMAGVANDQMPVCESPHHYQVFY